MKPHAFVAMPFGVKKDSQGNEIDFNRVYAELIKPALEAAGLAVFRADQEGRAGDIRPTCSGAAVADLVVADLTIDNPNVWYELGVRHALRARGVVLDQRRTSADRLRSLYRSQAAVRAQGRRAGPATLEQDKRALADMVKATMESWHGRR